MAKEIFLLNFWDFAHSREYQTSKMNKNICKETKKFKYFWHEDEPILSRRPAELVA